MTRLTALIVAALLAAACGKKDDDGGKVPAPAPAPAPGRAIPPRLAFGDCAGADVRFVSGPRPQPFQAPAAEPADGAAAEAEAPPPPADAGILGTGEGTIGTGKFGTLGRGSGVGQGFGIGTGGGYGPGGVGMPMQRPVGPRVLIGTPTVQGDLDKNIIRRYVRMRLNHIKYCYEKQLLVKPKLAGTVTATFSITPDGTVGSSKAEGVSPEVSSCIAGAIRAIQFPRSQSGGVVNVTYPFKLDPPEEQVVAPRRPPRPTPKPPADPPAVVADQPPPEPDAGAGAAPVPTGVLAAPYEPGRDSPLRARADAIGQCLGKHAGQSHGALVIDLTVDAAGAITAGRTHGVNEAVGTCLAEASRGLTWKGAAAGTYRCPAAFGTLGIDAAPSIDIAADAVLLGKDSVAAVKALMSGSDDPRIAALYDRLRAEQDRGAGATDVVAITGPRIIRPLDATPMRVVNMVVTTSALAGADVLLAAQRNGAWKLLRDVTLPLAPVPRGTGGAWLDGAAQRPRAAEVVTEDPVRIAVLITGDAVWIGLSRIGEQFQIKATASGHDWAALVKLLAEHKQSAWFTSRAEIELAGEGTVLYGDAVKLVDAATAVGFTDWTLTTPESLSVRFAR